MPRPKPTAENVVSSKPALPKGWQWVRFGDVIRDVMVRVDPETSGLTRYIAGEHLGSNDMRVRSWGTIGDGYLGPAFYRKFVKGQVLYLSRRPYLRKMGQPTFDGVCGEKTFVLEPKGQQLTADLLPFILQTEAFTEYAVSKSIGSVNPHVRFSDIANYHFCLPSDPVEQRRIAELLRAADSTVEAWREVCEREAALMDSLCNQLFEADQDRRAKMVRTDELLLAPVQNGISPRPNGAGEGVPTVALSAIQDGYLVADGHVKHVVVGKAEAERFRIRDSDLYVVRGNGSKELVGKCARVVQVPDGCIYPDLLMRLRFDPEKIRPLFAWVQWNSASAHLRLCRRAKSTNGIWKVNGQDVSQHALAVPGLGRTDTR